METAGAAVEEDMCGLAREQHRNCCVQEMEVVTLD